MVLNTPLVLNVPLAVLRRLVRPIKDRFRQSTACRPPAQLPAGWGLARWALWQQLQLSSPTHLHEALWVDGCHVARVEPSMRICRRRLAIVVAAEGVRPADLQHPPGGVEGLVCLREQCISPQPFTCPYAMPCNAPGNAYPPARSPGAPSLRCTRTTGNRGCPQSSPLTHPPTHPPAGFQRPCRPRAAPSPTHRRSCAGGAITISPGVQWRHLQFPLLDGTAHNMMQGEKGRQGWGAGVR